MCYFPLFAMRWQNIVCLAIGVALVGVGVLGKNLQFRYRHSREPIPNWQGRLSAIIVGALFLAFGLLGRRWR